MGRIDTTLRAAMVACGLAVALVAAAAPALADPPWKHGKRGHGHGYRGGPYYAPPPRAYYGPPRVYYAPPPPVYYAPPPVYYAPPPPVYYAPGLSLGINIPLR